MHLLEGVLFEDLEAEDVDDANDSLVSSVDFVATRDKRLVDLQDEVVEKAGVDCLGEGVAPVARLLHSEVLLDVLGAGLDLPLGKSLLDRAALQPEDSLAVADELIGGGQHACRVGLRSVELHVAAAWVVQPSQSVWGRRERTN